MEQIEILEHRKHYAKLKYKNIQYEYKYKSDGRTFGFTTITEAASGRIVYSPYESERTEEGKELYNFILKNRHLIT